VSEADAALVSVIAGEERTDIDITVRSITTATISGTVAIPVGVAASGAAVQCRSSAWVSIRLAKSVPRGERYAQIRERRTRRLHRHLPPDHIAVAACLIRRLAGVDPVRVDGHDVRWWLKSVVVTGRDAADVPVR
jgi:hypothetical protein